MGKKETEAVRERLARIPYDEERVLLATGKYIGEGFDDPRLDTLFVTLPISWRGTVAQYVGRLHRLHESKREVRVYDYADLDCPNAGADVCSALPRIRSRRIRHHPARRRDSGMAG
jgi:superfamily II DNA or RNA helicase